MVYSQASILVKYWPVRNSKKARLFAIYWMAEKRTFKDIREILLRTLAKGKNTLNNLAKEAGVNWRTTDNHLIYLKGKGLVAEVFTSAYVRIFELTEKGKEEAKKYEQT